MEALRYFSVAAAIKNGATCRQPSLSMQLVDMQISRTMCKNFNPNPDEVLPALCSTIDSYPIIKMPNLKIGFGITRSDVMSYFACFANDQRTPENVFKFSRFGRVSLEVINRIEKKANITRSPIDISGQLDVALHSAHGNLTKAVIYLALGTREIARVYDGDLVGGEIGVKRAMHWKNSVCAFGLSQSNEDTAGDTYHFWHAVLAGVAREEKTDILPILRIKQLASDIIYQNSAAATDYLRSRMFLGRKDGWNTHEIVDNLGYRAGRALVERYGDFR
jgi:hypothetical protein